MRLQILPSTLGRWITTDPKDMNAVSGGYHDGMNLYEYVGSSPIVFLDPFGLETKLSNSELQQVIDAIIRKLLSDKYAGHTSASISPSLKDRAAYYTGRQLDAENTTKLFGKLGWSTITSPIKVVKFIYGAEVAESVSKAIVNKTKEALKDAAEKAIKEKLETLGKKMQEASMSSSTDKGRYNTTLTIVYDTKDETFKGFIEGKVGLCVGKFGGTSGEPIPFHFRLKGKVKIKHRKFLWLIPYTTVEGIENFSLENRNHAQ